MANAEKVVEYLLEVIYHLIPRPADVVFAPLLKPFREKLKSWLGDKETQKALLEAAQRAEADFRLLARERFGSDELTQAVASFPLYNGQLFLAALQSLPSHLDETFLETHLGSSLAKYWPDGFAPEEVQAATALYLDCLRIRLLGVKGFAETITRLAVLRTDRRTEEILEGVNEIREKLSGETQHIAAIAFRSLHQLPQPPADFTGREEIIAQLLQDFKTHKGAAISWLTGMGGIGKTALGLVVAHRVAEEYPDAQIFLDLKGTTEPLSAVDIMRHVIVSFEPKMDLRALDEKGMADAYRTVLHNKKALLFLDNARSAEQIKPLIPPETSALLVTSRWSFPVSGLKNHALGVMKKEDAEEFLVELCPRTGEYAAGLAKACGYLPLALRIAGSFLQVNESWPVGAYVKQLNDRKGRLAALEESYKEAELKTEPDLLAAFELSYNQLAEDTKKYWRVLGIFPASFAMNAAQALWELGENETRKLLSLYGRYNLLDYDKTSARYILHDLLAEYACSQTNNGEEFRARLKHASHYKDVLANANILYDKGNENVLSSLHLFDLEWENFRTGQAWVKTTRENDPTSSRLCIEYANVGAYVLSLRLHPKEWIQWLETALTEARKIGNQHGESAALDNLGNAYYSLGKPHKAIELHKQALVIARAIGNRLGEGACLGNLGNAYHSLGVTQKAIGFYKEHLVITHEIGDRRGEGTSLINLGSAYIELREPHKAIQFSEQGLSIFRELGDRRSEGNALIILGNAYLELGEPAKAIDFGEQSLVIHLEIGDRRGEGAAFGTLAGAYAALGDLNKAIEYFEADLQIAHETNNRHREGIVLGNLGSAYHRLQNARNAVHFYQQALHVNRETGNRSAEGITSFNFGLALHDLGEKEQGIGLLQQARVILEEINSPYAGEARNKLREWGELPDNDPDHLT